MTEETERSTPADKPRGKLPPSRAGKKPVTAYVSRDIYKQLRLLGIELEKSNQQMVSEAVEDYLKRHLAE